MRGYFTLITLCLSAVLTLGQALNISAGRAYFIYNANDTLNTNSAYNLLSLEYDPTWSLSDADVSLLTENGIARDDETSGSGFAYHSRLGGRFSKAVSARSRLEFTSAGWLSVNPAYDAEYDNRGFEASFHGETSLDFSTYLNYTAEYTRMDYPQNPFMGGDVYALTNELSRSFKNGRSLRFRISGGLKRYGVSGEPFLVGGRFHLGQSLGNTKGLSGYVEGGMVFNAIAQAVPNNTAFDMTGDRYAYDKRGAGIKFKVLFEESRFSIAYDYENRAFLQMNREDNIHTAGIEWTNYLNNAAGERRFGFSLEPSAKLIQSNVVGEDYLAAYLMVGFER